MHSLLNKAVIKVMDRTDELEAKIRNWLSEQGYPLEMAVAQALRRSGFRAQQSSYYRDVETGTPREIDVQATTWRHFTQEYGSVYALIELGVSVCIECKFSNKPWLLFRSGEQHKLSKWTGAQLGPVCSVTGQEFLQCMFSHDLIQKCGIINQHKEIGYGLTQAFSTGDDAAYKAMIGSTKAAIADAIQNDGANSHSGDELYVLCSVAFPVVVLDGRLFECHLGEDESLVVSEISSAAIECKIPLLDRKGSRDQWTTTAVYIYSRSAIPQLVADFTEVADVMEKGLPVFLDVYKSWLDYDAAQKRA